MHAEKCPVCQGKGKIKEEHELGSSNAKLITCHGCNGKGWVEVQDNQITYIPYVPYYPQPYVPYEPYPNPIGPYYTSPNTSGDFIKPPDPVMWC